MRVSTHIEGRWTPQLIIDFLCEQDRESSTLLEIMLPDISIDYDNIE